MAKPPASARAVAQLNSLLNLTAKIRTVFELPKLFGKKIIVGQKNILLTDLRKRMFTFAEKKNHPLIIKCDE
jgi:hypothetical protein